MSLSQASDWRVGCRWNCGQVTIASTLEQPLPTGNSLCTRQAFFRPWAVPGLEGLVDLLLLIRIVDSFPTMMFHIWALKKTSVCEAGGCGTVRYVPISVISMACWSIKYLHWLTSRPADPQSPSLLSSSL